MFQRQRRHLRLTGGIAASILLLAACGGDQLEGGGDDGSGDGTDAGGEAAEAGTESLEGAEITVGSKDFDEQLVLGNISKLLLEDAGATVNDQINLGGTDAARAALTSGEIDHYWEYNGTAWISFFGETEPIQDRIEQYEVVRDRDAEENGLYWLDPSPFNNTYAIAYANSASDDLGNPETLSDLADIIENDPDQATLCVESEFSARDDGLPGMEAHYGYEFPTANVTVLDTGVVYNATAQRDPCNFGEVFITDGRVVALDLVVLEDDEAFFPLYNASPVYVEDVYEQYGQSLADLYAPVIEALDNDTMAELNARVSSDGERPAAVASDWLTENGFIGG
ncbi:MAG: glycine betaine ABC transporter substrate-binding protein, partial [Nitriliruptor sp.]|uniref:glycine betaine ABC transporter substrate-binding protein n=1 Tax=Nitriliruptor sp. TaxID=2448056 RepID=UPI0034A068B5